MVYFYTTASETWLKAKYKYGRDLDSAGAEECDDDRDAVDSELKLKELGYAVVNIATPHYCLDDTREVVVRQNDVRCLFRYVRARYTLHGRAKAPRQLTTNAQLKETRWWMDKSWTTVLSLNL